MKALPKLSKAQQEAWERVLEWRSTYRLSRSFRAGGTAKWKGNLEISVVASDATLQALERKGLLVSAGEKFGYPRYVIHPDYLPTSDQDAAPEAPVARMEADMGEQERAAIEAVKVIRQAIQDAKSVIYFNSECGRYSSETLAEIAIALFTASNCDEQTVISDAIRRLIKETKVQS